MHPSQRLRWISVLITLLGLAIHVAHSARPQGEHKDLAGDAAAALYDGIRFETLPNGLRVYLKPIPGSPVVTTKVAYRVGSADEDLDQTGLAHYLEHLLFKGTDRLMPGDIDRMTLRNGGANNAYTSDDYTIYHFDFAADRWEIALEIEADRMRNTRIDDKHEFRQEKGAVIEELARNEDQPWDLESKAILPLLFGKSAPYGHPTIGEREHVRNATAETIKGYYDLWYHPNNAALVICGGFDPERALARVKELFGPIPAGKLPERKGLPPGNFTRPARHEFESKFEVARLIMGFNTFDSRHADYHALDVMQGILAGGKTSRLYKRLVEGEQIAGMVTSSTEGARYPGWLGIYVQLLKGKDRAAAEKLVIEELDHLRAEPVSAAELRRVKQVIVSGEIFSRESVHGLADSIARGVTTNDLDFLRNYLPRISAVTAEDVQRVARSYLDPQGRVVVWSVPKPGESGVGSPESRVEDEQRDSRLQTPHSRPFPRLFRLQTPHPRLQTSSDGFSLQKARRVELPNGLVLLLFENRRLPIVVAEAVVKNVRLYEPDDKLGVAALTGMLLDEGTKQLTGQQIAEKIEDVGGNLSLGSAGGSVQALSPHRKLGLELLLDCLFAPSFPPDAFERQKARLLSEIDDNERQPDYRARTLYRELAYGKHPLGRPALGRRKTVEPLTAADCLHFHRRVFIPGNTVLAVVGDFDSDQVVEEIKLLTGDGPKTVLPRPPTWPVDKPEQFTQRIVTMPEAAQLQFFMGHEGIRRNSPDFYKLLVMDYVLGTGPGFTDRLSAKLRDREGLAYTVSAAISHSAGEEPGLFTCYIGTDARNFERVKGLFLEELRRIRTETPGVREVDDAKKYLLGNLPFKFTTNEQIAGQLLAIERYGLGFDYLDKYRQAVGAVTPEDVRHVARQYLDPERMILVAAGAVDEQGKPLGEKPPAKKR